MKNKELYLETVDIILDAYNDRKLVHSNPCGCFIGNIIAKKAKTETNELFIKDGWDYIPHWWESLYQKRNNVGFFRSFTDLITEYISKEKGDDQIKATGYTIEEVDRLERSFENAIYPPDWNYEKDQYYGMKAALEELAKIHETRSEESIEKLNKVQKEIYCEV